MSCCFTDSKFIKHVLFQDGGFIEPSDVFRIYIEKLFWEGEQKGKESEVDQPVSTEQINLFLLCSLRRNHFQSVCRLVSGVT